MHLSWSKVKLKVRALFDRYILWPRTLSANDEDWIWCLVGNIVEKHEVGEEHEVKYGTKHFSRGTKVYCFPPLWGDGYERIKVIGKPRKRKHLITIITRANCIENWRIKKVFNPFVLREMARNGGWKNTDRDKADIEKMIAHLNTLSHT